MRAPSLPPDWAAAIREDALCDSSSGVALAHAGIDQRIFAAHRVLIYVGNYYPTNPLSLHNGGAHLIEYVKTPPVCQACGQRMHQHDRAISYRQRREGWGWGAERFIHEDCPEEARHEGSDRGRRARGQRRAGQGRHVEQSTR